MDRIARHAAAAVVVLVLLAGGVASAQDTSASDDSENQCLAMPHLADEVDQSTDRNEDSRHTEFKGNPANRESDPLFVRFREKIKIDGKLSDGEMASLEQHIWRYHHDGGAHLRMRRAAQLAAHSPCQGQCFAAVLRFMQEAQNAGTSQQMAMTMSIRALQDEGRATRRTREARTKSQLIKGLQTRLQIRLMDWQREQQQSRDRDKARQEAMERVRQRAGGVAKRR